MNIDGPYWQEGKSSSCWYTPPFHLQLIWRSEVLRWRECTAKPVCGFLGKHQSMSGYREDWKPCPMLKNDSMFKMILHLPPRSPPDPLRQNTSTYLRGEERQENQWAHTQLYHNIPRKGLPFVSSGGDTAEHHFMSSRSMSPAYRDLHFPDLLSCFYYRKKPNKIL